MDAAAEATLRVLRQQDLLRAPCPGCGAQLTFRADTQQLGCSHCGATKALDFSRNRLAEIPLSSLLLDNELNPAMLVEQQLFHCPGCGARTRVAATNPTLSCGFCGNVAINPDAQHTRLIEPAGVLPFQLDRAAATRRFRHWLGSNWFAPGDLASGARLDNLRGICLPFWTFDAQANSAWRGERGHRYTETERGTDGNGRVITRQITRTDWTSASGRHEQFYDDVLTLASRGLARQQKYVGEVLNYDLKAVVDYDPRVLLGWEAEVYAIDLAEALETARATVYEQERLACSRELGGDVQRGLTVKTSLHNESFKHLLLPLWLCAYVYRGKLHHFLINGQTGRVSGSRPLSYWKIALVVLLGLLLLGGLFYARSVVNPDGAR